MQQQLTKQAPEGFLLVGRIDAPERPKAAIVIVHGLCEHFGRYDYVTQRLLEAGYAVVRFDHRGHGRSMGKKVWYDDRTQIVSDTDLFVEEARAQFPDLPVFMIGHSMGGFGAASYGTAHPGKLDGYVLSGAWTRDHTGLASGAVEQGLDPEMYIPNELGDGVCSDPAVGEAYLADPFVVKEFSTGTSGYARRPPTSPTRCSCCTAETTAWSARRTASICSAKSHRRTSRCASTQACATRYSTSSRRTASSAMPSNGSTTT